MAKSRAIVPQSRPGGKAGGARSRPAKSSRSTAKRALPWVIGGLLAVVIVAGLVLLVQNNSTAAPAPGEAIPIQGNAHIAVGAAHAPYNSDPPTSGPHYADPLGPGFYDTPQVDEKIVHSEEHGYIWIAYDCSKLTNCDQVKSDLNALVQSYNDFKIIASPRQNKDTAIGLAAWGRLEKLNTYDEPAIRQFVNTWRDKGPEQTPN